MKKIPQNHVFLKNLNCIACVWQIEECYIIMNGSGRMTVDGETAEVYAGDAILNRLGGSHGLYNHTHEDIVNLFFC